LGGKKVRKGNAGGVESGKEKGARGGGERLVAPGTASGAGNPMYFVGCAAVNIPRERD